MTRRTPRSATRQARHRAFTRRGVLLGAAGLLALGGVSSASAQASDRPPLPFFAGEQLFYRVRVSKVGSVGRGAMTVEGPVSVRGTDAYLLRFEFRTRVGFITAENRTESWLDPNRMAALRFRKRERHPLSRHDESIELFPDERRWDAGNGQTGETPTDAPLDELSFIYAIRTIPLPADTTYQLDRHFDGARNPVTLRVLGRDSVRTGAGTFPAVLVEMRVKDGRRYKGEGVIRIHFSDDEARLPLRIESAMPVLGTVVFTLESRTERPIRHASVAPAAGASANGTAAAATVSGVP